MNQFLNKLAVAAIILMAFVDGIIVTEKLLGDTDENDQQSQEKTFIEDILELFPKSQQVEESQQTQQPEQQQPEQQQPEQQQPEQQQPEQQQTEVQSEQSNQEQPTVEEPEIVPENNGTVYQVPFTSQAPYGTWGSPWSKYAEEACMYMAMLWVNGEDVPDFRQVAIDLYEIGEWEIAHLDSSDVTTAMQNRQTLMEYYGHNETYLTDNVDANSLIDALHSGSVVMLNVNGRVLDNLNYGGEGPENHSILLVGYDEDKEVFIANDPGTRYGEQVEYTYEKILAANQDLAILIKR